MQKKSILTFSFLLAVLICGMSLMSFTAEEGKVYVKPAVYDFGVVSPDLGKVTATFEIQNDSDKAICLTSVRASCGCTTPTWSKEPIAPGKSQEIQVEFNLRGQNGSVSKNVTVKTDSGETLIMNIKGMVKKEVEAAS